MKVLTILFCLSFFVSCGGEETQKERFVRVACDTYGLDECEFSYTSREDCKKFTSAIYDGNTPENTEKCTDCLELLGCDMWNNSESCSDECKIKE